MSGGQRLIEPYVASLSPSYVSADDPILNPLYPSPSVLITDTFSEADATNLHGKTTTTGGEVWTVNNGTLDIQSSKARPTAGAGTSWATIDTGFADIDLGITLTYHSDLDGVIFRVLDASNYIRMQVNSTADQVALIKNVAGSESNIGSWSVAVTPGETADFRVFAVGSRIEVHVNGTLRINVTESAHATATKHGVIGGASTNTRFDTFSVEKVVFGDELDSVPLDPLWTKRNVAQSETSLAATSSLVRGGTNLTFDAQGDAILRASPAGDFEVVASMNGPVTLGGMIGPCIIDSSGNGVSFSYYDTGIHLWVIAAYNYSSTGQSFSTAWAEQHWLRLKKSGTTYTGQYSINGTTWATTGGGIASAITPNRVGLLRAFTGGSSTFRLNRFNTYLSPGFYS